MFEEYSEDRVSVRREMKDGHNQGQLVSGGIKYCCNPVTMPPAAWTNVLCHYVSLLLGMLKKQVLHHSFTMATATMETMAMAMDQAPDVMRTVGVALMSHDRDDATYRAKLQMLKHMFTRYPKHVREYDHCMVHSTLLGVGHLISIHLIREHQLALSPGLPLAPRKGREA